MNTYDLTCLKLEIEAEIENEIRYKQSPNTSKLISHLLKEKAFIEHAIHVLQTERIDSIESVHVYEIDWGILKHDLNLNASREIIIPITLKNIDLLTNLHSSAENMKDYLSTLYGFDVYGFLSEIVEENSITKTGSR